SWENLCFYLQKVYWYFRGKGKEAEMRPDAAAGGSRF
ncbi:Os03g0582300, partial [Oryza sativa Japonica Group]